MRGFVKGERGSGYELLTRDWAVTMTPARGQRDLTHRVKVGPVAMMRLMWLSAVGVSGNMKNQG